MAPYRGGVWGVKKAQAALRTNVEKQKTKDPPSIAQFLKGPRPCLLGQFGVIDLDARSKVTTSLDKGYCRSQQVPAWN